MNPPPVSRLQGEIETPRPLRARGGSVEIAGWCLAEGEPAPPAVRLVTDAGILPLTRRVRRPDVAGKFPAEPAAAGCGFVIAGTLPPGVYAGRFEAEWSASRWQVFRCYTLAVEPPPLAAAIEYPPSPVTENIRVQGWALHPLHLVEELHLHYGHQRVSCEINLPRADVPGLFPGAPQAARAGFISTKNLPVGRGRLRLCARLGGGRIAYARTAHEIAVVTDEDQPQPLRLEGPRAALGPVSRLLPPPAGPAQTARPLNVLFVLYGDFFSNSALHIAGLANELAQRGHHPAVVVPRGVETLRLHAAPRFAAATYDDAADLFADGREPDVIHAWTTREVVRVFAEQWRERTGARLVVHLEDNEGQILAHALGRPLTELAALPEGELDRLVLPSFSHPHRSRAFLAGADGVTMILDRLREFVPPGRPHHTIWPAADERFFFPRPSPHELRAVLDPAPETTVLFYHGNVHLANRDEVRELYAAVLALNRAGHPTVLIRTGRNTCDFLGELAGAVAPHVLALGHVQASRHLAPLMALADVFVQPGVPDAFNDFRFPSKLPEFFALGRPVVLPRTNLGLLVRHGIDAYVLQRADAAGIAAAVIELRRSPTLARHLAAGAIAFGREHFSWSRSAAKLEKFYLSLLEPGRAPTGPDGSG